MGPHQEEAGGSLSSCQCQLGCALHAHHSSRAQLALAHMHEAAVAAGQQAGLKAAAEAAEAELREAEARTWQEAQRRQALLALQALSHGGSADAGGGSARKD